MKRILHLCIIPWLLTGLSSCQSFSPTSYVQTVTRNADGSTTTTSVPVMDLEDQAFHANCAKTLERTFQP
jgi:hypothetical protein